MSTLKAAWRCMAKERPFPWQSGLARGLRRDNVPWHFQLWMLPFFPDRHLPGSEARVLCNSVFQSPPYPHPLFWPKPCSDSRLTSANVALVDLRGLQLSFHCALVALLLTRVFFFFFFLSISYHVLGPCRLPGEGSYYHRPSCQEWHTSPYLKLLPQMTSSMFTFIEEEEWGTCSWGWQ